MTEMVALSDICSPPGPIQEKLNGRSPDVGVHDNSMTDPSSTVPAGFTLETTLGGTEHKMCVLINAVNLEM